MQLTTNPPVVTSPVLSVADHPVYLTFTTSSSNNGWPTQYFRTEHQVTAHAASIAPVAEWTSLDQALAGAAKLTQQRGVAIAVFRPEHAGEAYRAAELVVDHDRAVMFGQKQGSDDWTRLAADGDLGQQAGATFDARAKSARWDDQPVIEHVIDLGADKELVGIAQVLPSTSQTPERATIELVDLDLPKS